MVVPRPRRKSWSTRAAGIIRWLHLYLSLLGFTALLFFAVTGLTLNHPTWLGADTQRMSEFSGQLEHSWLSLPNVTDDPAQSVDRLTIVEHLRDAHGLRGGVTEFRVDDYECLVLFRGPAYAADVVINRENGEYTATQTVMGLVAIMNDLHKGRDSGLAWSLLIDASAILTAMVSITGLVLLFWLRRRRWSGLLTTVAGTIVLAAVYLFGVP
jgi:hypothetical protein